MIKSNEMIKNEKKLHESNMRFICFTKNVWFYIAYMDSFQVSIC